VLASKPVSDPLSKDTIYCPEYHLKQIDKSDWPINCNV